MVDVLFLIARVVLGGFYLYNAWNHFSNYKGMSAYAGSKGIPMPTLAVLGGGVLLLVGGLSILTGFYPEIGVAMVVLFLVPVAFMMHDFWAINDPQQKMGQQVNFLKNIALAASALMFLMISEPWPFSL